jgi:hypothetical protein
MGCQVLIKKHNSPGDDTGMRWMRGDPVIVRGIGQVWGHEEDPDTSDKFVILTVTDVTVSQATNWLERHAYEGEGEDEHTTHLRLRRLIWANLPQGVKDQLIATGRYTTTWVAIKQFIKNMQSGEFDL